MKGGEERKQSKERWRDKQRSSSATDNDALRPLAKSSIYVTGWHGKIGKKWMHLFAFGFISVQMSSHCAV